MQEASTTDAPIREGGASDASSDGEAMNGAPRWLSATGLYAPGSTSVLGEGVAEYTPVAALWSDRASKRRFVRLPPGTRIDTTDMDGWRYPPSTRLWKEFALDGHRLETRLLEKRSGADGDFTMIAYRWNAEGTDAEAVPEGATNVGGTQHDVPSAAECGRCHGGLPDVVLGFSAIQLAHDGPGVTLTSLANEGRLTAAPTTPLVIPGDALDRTALSYLHANCGHCHNARTVVGQRNGFVFWLQARELSTVESTGAFRTGKVDRTRASTLDESMILQRMRFRGNGQMPPLATEQPDEAGIDSVRSWLARIAAD